MIDKPIEEMTTDELDELVFQQFGVTLELDATTALSLHSLKQQLGMVTMTHAAKFAIVEMLRHTEAVNQKTPETRPLVSLGQGEYRRDIMAEDC